MSTNEKKPFTWSYSALSSYETCPAQAAYRKAKTPTKLNKYLIRGIAVHQEGEDYMSGKIRNVPKAYSKFADQMKYVRKIGGISEAELAFTRQWDQTGYWAKDVWLRVKMDLRWMDPNEKDLLNVVDYKTGTPKASYKLQDLIYTVTGFLAHQEAMRLQLQMWYLDHGVVMPERSFVVKRSNILRGGLKELELRAKRFENEKDWKPKKGSHCQYCDYSKRKGGPCKY